VSLGSGGARRLFDAQDVVIALAVALLAQLGFVLAFSLPSPKLVHADISNENARPIAVAITPVLKLGSKTPTKLPAQWQRRRPIAAKTEPAAVPSPQAEKSVEAIPKPSVRDAAAASSPTLTPLPEPQETNRREAATSAASTEGSEQGAANGTETDPFKARAADEYRQEIAAWFASRFQIQGKLPFEKLKTLHALAVVTVTADRRVGSFTLVRPSGDPTFDAEVRETLSRVQASGAELPAPPPRYPDMLGQSRQVGFQCTIARLCQ
jgi:outer membrane biosynthesis protein TonB